MTMTAMLLLLLLSNKADSYFSETQKCENIFVVVFPLIGAVDFVRLKSLRSGPQTLLRQINNLGILGSFLPAQFSWIYFSTLQNYIVLCKFLILWASWAPISWRLFWHRVLLGVVKLPLTSMWVVLSIWPVNTHLLCKGKYHCTADLLFDWFGFLQTSKCVVN